MFNNMLLSLLRPLVVRIELMWGGIFLPEVVRQKGYVTWMQVYSLLTPSTLTRYAYYGIILARMLQYIVFL